MPMSGRNGGMNGTNGSAEPRRWRFHRFRDDKTEGNHVSTYTSVIESIQDHVTEDDLLASAGEIRTAWKARNQQGARPGGK